MSLTNSDSYPGRPRAAERLRDFRLHAAAGGDAELTEVR